MKKLWLLIFVCLTAVALLMLSITSSDTQSTTRVPSCRIALLTANETGSLYLQIKQGALDAADYLNADLTIQTINTANPQALAEELHNSETIAAVLFIDDMDATAVWVAALQANDVLTVTLGNDLGDCEVLSDTAANTLAFIDAASAYGSGRLLLTGNGNEDLYRAILEKWQGDVLTLQSPADAAIAEEGDAIIALDSTSAKAILDLKESGSIPADTPFFCYDTGDSRAVDLETGMIQGMLLLRPYTVGYRALQTAQRVCQNENAVHTVHVAAAMITKDEMYLPENVNIVFPLLQ